MGWIKQQPEPCPPGHCDMGYNRDGMKLCRKCGYTAQTLCSGRSRHPMPGDYRVICHTTPCPIGPSRVIPGVFEDAPIEAMNEHQREAVEIDGEPHDVEIKEYPIEVEDEDE